MSHDDDRIAVEPGYRQQRHVLHVHKTAVPLLMNQLADVWEAVGREVPSSLQTNRSAINSLCAWLGGQLGVDETFEARHLRRRHLDGWELSQLRQQQQKPSDTPYRRVVYLFALLRRMADDGLHNLHQEIRDRIEQPTRLSHIRREPLPDFPAAQRKAIKHATRTVLSEALKAQTKNPERGATSDALIALHIQLALATGEPPEAIRRLSLDDVIATPNPRSPIAGGSLTEIAQADAADLYAVTYTKARGGIRYEEVYTRTSNLAAHRALTTLLRLTAPHRQAATTRSLWILPSVAGDVVMQNWADHPLRAWLDLHVDIPIPGAADYRRFRKTAIARAAIKDPARYLRTQRRHSAAQFFDHYTNSPELRQHAGKIVVDRINELWLAATGPTIVTPQGTLQLDIPSSTIVLADPLDDSTAHGPLADCRDPEDSPHAPEGTTCPFALTGTCFTCPNAVITTEHLPATVLLNRISAPDSAADVRIWRELWEPIHTATTAILEQFPAAAVATATQHTDDVIVDLGLRHGPRGSDG